MENLYQPTVNDEQTNQSSLLTVLNKFVQAVDSMDDTVMIPVRLKDMEITSTNRPVITEENNNKALLPMVSQGTDLYSFYGLLKTIKNDLIVGKQEKIDETAADTEGVHEGESGATLTETADMSAKKTAAAFRHHLTGLFTLLHEMTETANYLSNRYESEVGHNSKKPNFSTFTRPL